MLSIPLVEQTFYSQFYQPLSTSKQLSSQGLSPKEKITFHYNWYTLSTAISLSIFVILPVMEIDQLQHPQVQFDPAKLCNTLNPNKKSVQDTNDKPLNIKTIVNKRKDISIISLHKSIK